MRQENNRVKYPEAGNECNRRGRGKEKRYRVNIAVNRTHENKEVKSFRAILLNNMGPHYNYFQRSYRRTVVFEG